MTEKIDLNELKEDYNSYIKRVQQGTLKIAEDFRQKDIKNGLGSITDFAEGMDWIIAVNKHFSLNDIPTSFDEKKIIGFLEEINEALSVQDYFLVADLFEYEIAGYFAEIPDVIIKN
ncbi:hypothetical protein ACIQZG_04675 [Lysinibacillus sp. NPDC096418]|uniref:hypothetical protein n=1 Tax=Lysinibacillus sp. NPDC096418 TaxID=3364138 RepID=UPI003801ED33